MLHQLKDPHPNESPDAPLPPFFNVGSPGEIADVLRRHDRDSLRSMGAECRAWFGEYQGANHVEKYIRLLNAGVQERRGKVGRGDVQAA